MKRILCAVFLFFVVGTAMAAESKLTNDVFCKGASTGRTLVVFGNGIMNTGKDAEASARRLRALLRAEIPREEFDQLDFGVAGNQSYWIGGDLFESLLQKFGSDNFAVSFWRWLANREAMPDAVRKELLDMASGSSLAKGASGKDLQNQLVFYRTQLSYGKRIVGVAHSQGNFSINLAYELLKEENPSLARSFGIVAVASPASYVADNGPHITLVEDIVIDAVRIAAPALGVSLPLSADGTTNIGSGAWTSDPIGHSFGDEYTAIGSNSMPKVITSVRSVIDATSFPQVALEEAVVSITLTSGAGQDEDLHVYEVDRPYSLNYTWSDVSHVSSLSPVGQFGQFDLIDTAGYGLERYVVSCTDLRKTPDIMVYTIGVAYSRGMGPSTAILTIKTGTTVQSYTVYIVASGNMPNYQVVLPAASIGVLRDTVHGGYRFTVSTTGVASPVSVVPTPHYGAF